MASRWQPKGQSRVACSSASHPRRGCEKGAVMTAPGVVMVTSKDGVRGAIDTTAWPLDSSKAEVLVQIESGQQVLVPMEALIQQGEGHYALTMDLAALAQQHGGRTL